MLQAFGTAGLIETVVEFTYVLTNRDNFTEFEKVFFIASGSCEMAGELLFLFGGCWMLRKASSATLRTDYIKMLARDPIHNMAGYSVKTNAREEFEQAKYFNLSWIAVGVSVFSFFCWAIGYPLWCTSFDGDGDQDLRVALSVVSAVSLVCCALAYYTIIIRKAFGSRFLRTHVLLSTFPVLYAIEKVFEVYILLSDLDRLCPGDLGTSLVVLQMLEIASVLVILGRSITGGIVYV